VACLGAAVLWASNGVVSKYLMNGGLSPFVLAQGRMTFGAILTVTWLLLTRPKTLIIRPRDIISFILLGSLGLAAVNCCYLSAISKIPTAAAILLEYLAPALIAVYAWWFMGERMGLTKIMALGLALGGCYLVVGGYNIDLLNLNRSGLIWGLGAAVTFAFYCVYSEYNLRSYSPWTMLCYALIAASMTFNLALGPAGLLTMGWDEKSWLLICYSVSIGTIVPFGIFAYGIDNLRATRATIISTFEPIAAGLIAYLWLGERLEGLQMLGGLGVLFAVFLIQKERERDLLAPAMIKKRNKYPN
jgi:drug/metabolite transporter (DMT)-like permease